MRNASPRLPSSSRSRSPWARNLPHCFRRLPRLRLQQYLHELTPLSWWPREGRWRKRGFRTGDIWPRQSSCASSSARRRIGGARSRSCSWALRCLCSGGHSVPAVCRVLADAFGALRAGGRPCFFLVVGHSHRFGGGVAPGAGRWLGLYRLTTSASLLGASCGVREP